MKIPPLSKQLKIKMMLGIAIGCAVTTSFHFAARAGISLGLETQTLVRCLPFSLSVLSPLEQNELTKGELVTIDHTHLPGEFRESTSNKILKIIVGVEGDQIERKENQIFVNQKVVGEYNNEDPHGFSSFLVDGDVFYLGPDEYWVMGSYKTASDSRYVGPVTREHIVELANPIL